MSNARIAIPIEAVIDFCRRHYIRRLALFGSVVRDDFTPDSDVDVLVELEPGHVPGLAFFGMQDKLSEILCHSVDLNTPDFLSPYFRDAVLASADVLYDPFIRLCREIYSIVSARRFGSLSMNAPCVFRRCRDRFFDLTVTAHIEHLES